MKLIMNKNHDISSNESFHASDPKSGSTWLRFFIANLYNEAWSTSNTPYRNIDLETLLRLFKSAITHSL